jgi:predicted secreted protein
MRTLILTSSVAALSLCAVGVGAAATASKVPVYVAKDSGHTVHVAKSHEFKVILATASDGGYSWTVKHRPASKVVAVVSKKVKPYHHKRGVVGAGSRTIYTFRATGAGKTSFRLIERQPFNKKHVVERFNLKEIVKH